MRTLLPALSVSGEPDDLHTGGRPVHAGLAGGRTRNLVRRDGEVKGNLVSRRKSAKYLEIGVRIGNLRREWAARTGKRLRQEDLAKAIQVDLSTVTAWETGRQRPMGENLKKLADFFQVDTHEITGENGARGMGTEGNPERTGKQAQQDGSLRRTDDGRIDLAAEIRRINALPIEEWRKDLKIAQLEALIRSDAMASDARAREADAKAADQRARAARVAALVDLNRTRFLSRVEDAAMREAARLRESERLRRSQEGRAQSAEETG